MADVPPWRWRSQTVRNDGCAASAAGASIVTRFRPMWRGEGGCVMYRGRAREDAVGFCPFADSARCVFCPAVFAQLSPHRIAFSRFLLKE